MAWIILGCVSVCANLAAEDTTSDASSSWRSPQGFEVSLAVPNGSTHNPNTLCFDPQGRLWIGENSSVVAKGRLSTPQESNNRILIFEDSTGDGLFDKQSVFSEFLPHINGLELGHGGVWVGSVPDLIFIPDRNRDDQPDGNPEVVVEGWTAADDPTLICHFQWGPDGWLYGTRGSTWHPIEEDSKITVPRNRQSAGIWRLHPQTHEFEEFAQTNDPLSGLSFGPSGELFAVSPSQDHLWHVIQGAHHARHPEASISPINTHHYLAFDGRKGGDRSSGLVIYQGSQFPRAYQGSALVWNVDHKLLYIDELTPEGSGFIARHQDATFLAGSPDLQGIDLELAPDGSIILLAQSSKSGSGQVWRFSHGKTADQAIPDWNSPPARALVDHLQSANGWVVNHALSALAERHAAGEDMLEARDRLRNLINTSGSPEVRLRGLWGLHRTGGIARSLTFALLFDSSPELRAWAIRLDAEDREFHFVTAKRLATMAAEDKSPLVSRALSSAGSRVSTKLREDILTRLVQRSDDVTDPCLLQLYAQGIHSLSQNSPSTAFNIAKGSVHPSLWKFVARELTAGGKLDTLVSEMNSAPEVPLPDEFISATLDGIAQGLNGQGTVDAPEDWQNFTAHAKRLEEQPSSALPIIEARLGLANPVKALAPIILSQSSLAQRQLAINVLTELGDEAALGPLLKVAGRPGDPAIRDAIAAASKIGGKASAETLIANFPDYSPEERAAAFTALTSRPEWVPKVLEAISDGIVPQEFLTPFAIAHLQLLGHTDKALIENPSQESPKSATGKFTHFTSLLTWGNLTHNSDIREGRKLFDARCSKCHSVFTEGGDVGPDLTHTRDEGIHQLITHIMFPSVELEPPYRTRTVEFADGRIASGRLSQSAPEGPEMLSTPLGDLILSSDDVILSEELDVSLMPSNLLEDLDDQQVIDLIAYLTKPLQQVPLERASVRTE